MLSWQTGGLYRFFPQAKLWPYPGGEPVLSPAQGRAWRVCSSGIIQGAFKKRPHQPLFYLCLLFSLWLKLKTGSLFWGKRRKRFTTGSNNCLSNFLIVLSMQKSRINLPGTCLCGNLDWQTSWVVYNNTRQLKYIEFGWTALRFAKTTHSASSLTREEARWGF